MANQGRAHTLRVSVSVPPRRTPETPSNGLQPYGHMLRKHGLSYKKRFRFNGLCVIVPDVAKFGNATVTR